MGFANIHRDHDPKTGSQFPGRMKEFLPRTYIVTLAGLFRRSGSCPAAFSVLLPVLLSECTTAIGLIPPPAHGPKRVFVIYEQPAFLTETMAIEKARATLIKEGYEIVEWTLADTSKRQEWLHNRIVGRRVTFTRHSFCKQ